MTIHETRRPVCVAGALAAILMAFNPADAALMDVARIVMQKGRHFAPTDLFLRRGDTIRLVNGDGGAIHHAFIEADRFTFDAGDQEPGSETRLTLTEPGDFVVRCGIHPKMKLTIHVQ